MHWAEGAFGYFPTYSLGNVIAGQLWQAINEAIPDLDEQIERGEFLPLREWLRENVHRHGRKLTAAEIVERVTGGPIETGPYVRYLRDKVGQVYGLPVGCSPPVGRHHAAAILVAVAVRAGDHSSFSG